MAEAAAERVIARISENPGRVAICLTGGSSPKQLYQLLGTDAWRSRIPWQRVHWFIGDERFVPADDPAQQHARGAENCFWTDARRHPTSIQSRRVRPIPPIPIAVPRFTRAN